METAFFIETDHEKRTIAIRPAGSRRCITMTVDGAQVLIDALTHQIRELCSNQPSSLAEPPDADCYVTTQKELEAFLGE